MRAHGISEETKEKVLYGCFLGLVLFASSAVYLSFSKDTAAIAGILKYVPVALIVYLLVGNLFIWLYNRQGNRKISQWFNGRFTGFRFLQVFLFYCRLFYRAFCGISYW